MAGAKGTRSIIRVGKLKVPAKLYVSASAEKISFNMITPDGNRVKQQYVDAINGKVVSTKDCNKGYTLANGEVVVFSKEEVKELEEKNKGEINILEFVPNESVNQKQVEKCYYIQPDLKDNITTKNPDAAYQLLVGVMKNTNKMAVGLWAVRGKEHLVVLQPYQHGLLLNQMFYETEMRNFDNDCSPNNQPSNALLAKAEKLVEGMSAAAFNASKYEDEYMKRVADAVRTKVETGTISIAKPVEELTEESLDDALDASLGLIADGGATATVAVSDDDPELLSALAEEIREDHKEETPPPKVTEVKTKKRRGRPSRRKVG
jgi:DNA end-binding protein Ku